MKRREKLIELINKTEIREIADIELDNLDRAELVQGEEKVMVENEHGTVFGLEELSDTELECFAVLLGIKVTFDYLIVDEDNNWLSYGNQFNIDEIEQEVDELKKSYKKEKVIVFYAKEMHKLEIQY